MKLGPILLLVTGGEALKEKSEFEQSGAIAEDIFITEGKSFNPTTNPTQTKNLTMTKISKKPFKNLSIVQLIKKSKFIFSEILY